MLKFLIKECKILKDKDGYYWMDTKEQLGERTFIKHKCPECGESHDIHPIKSRIMDSRSPTHKCDMVYGRRGWRRLGEYDS